VAVSLARGRRLPGPHAGAAVRAEVATRRLLPPGSRLLREVVEASGRAAAIRAEAEAEAGRIRAAAVADAAEVAARAAAAARTAAVAELAARQLALRVREERQDEAALERLVALARALAERLLGEALALDPGRVVALARQALREASGARQAVVVACPADAAILAGAIAELDPSGRAVAVTGDPALTPGSLRIRTDLGEVDASLGEELGALTRHLRESLAS